MLTKDKAKIIGWIGIDKYDLIMYFSMLLSGTNKKVLLIDQSENEALSYCIPVPGALNPKGSKVSYKNIDFINGKNVVDFMDDYDYILIDFGFKTTHRDVYKCNKIFLVTDRQQHNIDRITNLKAETEEVFLIYRDSRRNKISVLQSSIEQIIPIKSHFILDFYDFDKDKMVALQYSNQIQIHKLPRQMKYLLEQIMTEILNFNHYELGQAYKKLKRGA